MMSAKQSRNIKVKVGVSTHTLALKRPLENLSITTCCLREVSELNKL